MQAAARAGRAGGGARPAQPARRRGDRGGRRRARRRVVRGAGLDPGPPRPDHRRDGAAGAWRACPGAAQRFASPLDCDLEVVPMRGWRRRDTFEATGLPWVLPSPNMPTVDTAFVYPGLCLIEGTNVSEGRGTHPAVRDHRRALHRRAPRWPSGCRPTTCRACASGRCRFRPTFHKYARQVLRRHPAAREPTGPPSGPTAPASPSCASCGRWGRAAFAWRTEPYEFVSHRPAIDLLTGGDAVRLGIERGGRPRGDLRHLAARRARLRRAPPALPALRVSAGSSSHARGALRRQLQPSARRPPARGALRARDRSPSTSCG